MLNIPRNESIGVDETPLRYDRVFGHHASTFYFRCSLGHLGKYDLPVSTFSGFEGTVKERLHCTWRNCAFNDWVFLDGWVYRDTEGSSGDGEQDVYLVVDSQGTQVEDRQQSAVSL